MHGITHPDWEYMFMTGKSGVMYLMLETIAIAVAGTCAGAVFAVILTLINSRKFIPAPMEMCIRDSLRYSRKRTMRSERSHHI